jgi:hypothetical protein
MMSRTDLLGKSVLGSDRKVCAACKAGAQSRIAQVSRKTIGVCAVRISSRK